MEDKLKAIRGMPMRSNKALLQSFLGLLSFYDRFLLYRASKAVLAALAKLNDDGNEDPIIFTSRTLGKAERNYSQPDREGLAIMFAMDRFHKYIAGRHVTVTTEHQPLLEILGANSQVPSVRSPRMRRCCVKLSAYDYNLVYHPGKDNQNADTLSRLPLPENEDEPCPPGNVLTLEAFTEPPMTAQVIATKTQADTTLSRIYQAVQEGTLKMLQEKCSHRTRRRRMNYHRIVVA